MIRFGLCCIFHEQPIRFRTSTAKSVLHLSRNDALRKLSELSLQNVESLFQALNYCHANGIGSFRIQSNLFPLRTHPKTGYEIDELPHVDQIYSILKRCREFSLVNDIRTSFHPDQFVVLNSLRQEVVESSIEELEHHGEMCELVGADVINIHAGGVYGDMISALDRFEYNVNLLSDGVRDKLTLENDDTSYAPADLLPLCWRQQIPLVYDVHHHRCLPDGFSISEVTEMALTTWNREPLFHISSPINGWEGANPKRHHDLIDANDFPREWLDIGITVEIEAKAKEVAVLKLMGELINSTKEQSQYGHNVA